MKRSHKLYLSGLLLLAVGPLSGCAQAAQLIQPAEPGVESVEAPIMGADRDVTAKELARAQQGTSSTTEAFKGIVRLHYHSLSGADQPGQRAIYIWAPNLNGQQFDWTGFDDFGAYYDLDCDQGQWKDMIYKQISCIVKGPVVGDWGIKTSDTQIGLLPMIRKAVEEGGRLVAHVYLADGNGNELDVFSDKDTALQDNFRTIKPGADWYSFRIKATATPATKIRVYKFDRSYYEIPEAAKKSHVEDYFWFEADQPSASEFMINTPSIIDPQLDYMFTTNFDSSKPTLIKSRYATMDSIYDSKYFVDKYTYAGHDLGVKYYGDRTEFRLWAPTAVMAQVIVYDSPNPGGSEDIADDGTVSEPSVPGSDLKRKVMTLYKQRGGVFAGAIAGDWKGRGYMFRVYYEGQEVEVIDPYAFAAGVNGERAAIIDFSETNPEGWDTVKVLSTPLNKMSVYEVHTRDFTAHQSWVSNEGNKRGTYLAMAESGTSITKDGVTYPTGFDHVKKLGVKAVQILPMFDSDNNEVNHTVERDGQTVVVKPEYNWGYNPKNFNVVDGAYCSDAFNPVTRVREFKTLVKKYADSGIGVIMDVVYNHVASLANSPLNKLVPKYYFLYMNDSSYDTSGCGNGTHSSRVMFDRFMTDSLSWWAKEYKLKGFRFDLMGCISSDAMRHAKDALYAIDPGIVCYGEGWWATGDPGSVGIAKPANTWGVYKYLGNNGLGAVGGFNAGCREAYKGECRDELPRYQPDDNGNGPFINASSPSQWAVDGIRASIAGCNSEVGDMSSPSNANQAVNYLACHDNYTLYDHMNYSLHAYNDRTQWTAINEDSKKAAVALISSIMVSNGCAFLHGGDEFMRQKIMRQSQDPELWQEMKAAGNDGFDAGTGVAVMRNSYKYGDNVNAFNWNLVVENKNYVNAVADVIKFRNENIDAIGSISGTTGLTGMGAGNACIGFKLGSYYCGFRGNSQSASLGGLPTGNYNVVYSSQGRTGTYSSSGTFAPYQFEYLILKK